MPYTVPQMLDELDSRNLDPVGEAEYATNMLIAAREVFKRIDNHRTADRVRKAISSAKGAVRIQRNRRVREEMGVRHG